MGARVLWVGALPVATAGERLEDGVDEAAFEGEGEVCPRGLGGREARLRRVGRRQRAHAGRLAQQSEHRHRLARARLVREDATAKRTGLCGQDEGNGGTLVRVQRKPNAGIGAVGQLPELAARAAERREVTRTEVRDNFHQDVVVESRTRGGHRPRRYRRRRWPRDVAEALEQRRHAAGTVTVGHVLFLEVWTSKLASQRPFHRVTVAWK